GHARDQPQAEPDETNPLHQTMRYRWRISRDEFAVMPRSGSDWAAAARIGGRMPRAARDSPTILYSAVKPRFIFTTRIVRCAMRSTSGTMLQSSRISAIWAA